MMHTLPLTQSLSQKLGSDSFTSEYVSLEDNLIATYAANVQKFDQRKQHVLDLVSSSGSVTSPETLFAIQQQTADYNIEVSLISALTRKATGAVETLLRA